MRIQAVGGTVDRSSGCLLIESAGRRILIDPGLSDVTPATVAELKAAGGFTGTVVTHAHIDHMGALPLVVAAFPGMPILATPPTLALLNVLLADSLRLRQASEHSEESHAEVAALLAQARPIPFNQPTELSDRGGDKIGWKLTLLPAGHVLGAAMVYLEASSGTVVVTGDMSSLPQHTVRRAVHPPLAMNVLILESTYGDRTFRPRKVEEAGLLNRVQAALDRGGHVLIGTPALGTAQEILMVLVTARLRGRLTSDIWVDGQVRDVNTVYACDAPDLYPRLARFIAMHGNPFLPENGLVRAVAKPVDRRALLAGAPAVIVTTSPSLTTGPSRYYATMLARGSKHLLLVPEQLNALQYAPSVMAQGGPRCSVDRYSLGVHSDSVALASLAARWKPDLTVLVHGTRTARQKLGARLTQFGLAHCTLSPGESVTHIVEPAT